MTRDTENTATNEAQRMLDTFGSAGAHTFDLTLTTLQGAKVRYRSGQPLEDLRRALPSILAGADHWQHNVIVRPHAPHTVFIQLDDLTAGDLQRVQPVALLCLHTSPGNYQAWVAMPTGADADFARRLRKGTHADPSASGATRIAGSLNFKAKYNPSFPRVAMTHSAPGLVVSTERLDALGLVAAPEAVTPPAPVRASLIRAGVKKWPSYQRCVAGAPPNHSRTAPDISRADFAWCMTAIDWGWSIEDTASRLMEESTKAQENGERYALLTAQNAAAAVMRRRGQSRL